MRAATIASSYGPAMGMNSGTIDRRCEPEGGEANPDLGTSGHPRIAKSSAEALSESPYGRRCARVLGLLERKTGGTLEGETGETMEARRGPPIHCRLGKNVGHLSIALILAGLSISGCGGDEGESSSPATSSPATSSPATSSPVVTPIPGERKITADQTDFGPPRFKTCHGMTTRAVLYPDLAPPRVLGITTLWSHCWIGGFTGAAAVLVLDRDGDLVAFASPPSMGVQTDVTVNWEVNMDPSAMGLADTIRIEHTHAPRNRLLPILEDALKLGKSLFEIAAAITALAV
jgi:hypothetical protein